MSLGACAPTRYGSVNMTSDPSGAQIYDMEDGSFIGVTDLNYVWKSRDSNRKFMNVRLHLPGYQDYVSTFWLNLDYGNASDAKANAQAVDFTLKPLAD